MSLAHYLERYGVSCAACGKDVATAGSCVDGRLWCPDCRPDHRAAGDAQLELFPGVAA